MLAEKTLEGVAPSLTLTIDRDHRHWLWRWLCKGECERKCDWEGDFVRASTSASARTTSIFLVVRYHQSRNDHLQPAGRNTPSLL